MVYSSLAFRCGASFPGSDGPVCVAKLIPPRAFSAGLPQLTQRVYGTQRDAFARPTAMNPAATLADHDIGLLVPSSHQRLFAFSPSSASKNNLTFTMAEDAVDAESAYTHSGKLPSKMSPTSTLDLIAIATAQSDSTLRQLAFQELSRAFIEQRDTFDEYCLALLRTARVGKFTCLTEAQNESLQVLSQEFSMADDPQDQNLDPWLRLSNEELIELHKVLQSRKIGPVPAKLGEPFGNYHWLGKAERIILNGALGAQVTVRIGKTRDIQPFVQYFTQLEDGKVGIDAVRNSPLFFLAIKKLEISSELLQKPYEFTVGNQKLNLLSLIEQLKKRNPSLQISYDPTDFPERSSKKQAEKIPYFNRFYATVMV
jgi:hypothetical protein